MAFYKAIQKYKLHHLLFWLLLFSAWYYFRFQDYSTSQKALMVTFIKVADLALMVYITNYLLIPRLIYSKRYVWFTLIFIIMIVSSSTYKLYIIGNILTAGHFNVFDQFKTRVYDNVIPHFLLVSTGAAFKLLLDYAKAQRRIGEITKEKAEAELNFLKSQINPHFVFNSLNSIYFLINKENTDARQALHKFSDMLRYQLYELNGEKIAIEKEISYLQDYVDLQRLRRDENCMVNFTCNAALKNFTIEPLLLIPFVENSFKHLSHYSNGKQNEVSINIERSNGEMKFDIFNTTEDKPPSDLEKHGGIGLANVKRRLELLYPNRHQLNIRNEDDRYNVELKITI
jgi:two-component system LytT family sensor kinase